MSSSYVLAYRDYDGEISTATFRGATLSAGNYAAQEGLRAALEIATNAIVIGQEANEKVIAVDEVVSGLKASNAFAQRETKWLVKYTETSTGGTYSLEIPCANLAYLAAGGGVADLAGVEISAFVDAFEAFVLGPGGTAVVVVEIQHVGRNL